MIQAWRRRASRSPPAGVPAPAWRRWGTGARASDTRPAPTGPDRPAVPPACRPRPAARARIPARRRRRPCAPRDRPDPRCRSARRRPAAPWRIASRPAASWSAPARARACARAAFQVDVVGDGPAQRFHALRRAVQQRLGAIFLSTCRVSRSQVGSGKLRVSGTPGAKARGARNSRTPPSWNMALPRWLRRSAAFCGLARRAAPRPGAYCARSDTKLPLPTRRRMKPSTCSWP